MTDADKVDKFVDSLDFNLLRLERSKDTMRVTTSRHLQVALSACGVKKRSKTSMKYIEDALASKQVYASPALGDLTLGLKQVVYFSRTQPDSSDSCRRLKFAREQDMAGFLIGNFDFLFPELRLQKSEYKLPSGDRVDILARDRKSRDFVVIELKVGRDRGTPTQIIGYMEEIGRIQQGERNPVSVRGMVITSNGDDQLIRHLDALAHSTGFDISWFDCHIDMLLHRVNAEPAPKALSVA